MGSVGRADARRPLPEEGPSCDWWRGPDLNRRPSGYEPDTAVRAGVLRDASVMRCTALTEPEKDWCGHVRRVGLGSFDTGLTHAPAPSFGLLVAACEAVHELGPSRQALRGAAPWSPLKHGVAGKAWNPGV